jgi:ArsR family transcriptional regulator, arsenate/arsenite/antimonite-responsive transcriptional repressor
MQLDEKQALDAFAALSQSTRLAMLRALVVAGPAGMAAGAIGERVGVSSSSASFHLAHLERAGLVQSRRQARSIIYTAHYPVISGLVEFLLRDCCQGRAEVCVPALRAVTGGAQGRS